VGRRAKPYLLDGTMTTPEKTGGEEGGETDRAGVNERVSDYPGPRSKKGVVTMGKGEKVGTLGGGLTLSNWALFLHLITPASRQTDSIP